jgi:hypothetical protein
MIQEIKFVRNVLSVNQIPNQIHPINIPKSTQSIHKEIENHVIRTKIFIVLLITPIISSLLASSQIFAASRYLNSLDCINFDAIKVRAITTTTKNILIAKFNKNSPEKNQRITSPEVFADSGFPEDTTAQRL